MQNRHSWLVHEGRKYKRALIVCSTPLFVSKGLDFTHPLGEKPRRALLLGYKALGPGWAAAVLFFQKCWISHFGIKLNVVKGTAANTQMGKLVCRRPRGCVQHADGTDRRGRYDDGIFWRWLRYRGRREADVCGAWSRCVYTVIPQLKISSMSPGCFPDWTAKISAPDIRGQNCTTQTLSWLWVKKRILWCDKALRTIYSFNYTECSFTILIEHTERIKKTKTQELKNQMIDLSPQQLAFVNSRGNDGSARITNWYLHFVGVLQLLYSKCRL